MPKDFYEQKDQVILIVHEQSYGFPEQDAGDPASAWISPASGYGNWQRIDIMQEGIDIPPPIRKKDKFYDIGSGKHPSHLINKMIEPITFTLDVELQHAVFLAYAVGLATTVDKTTYYEHDVAEYTTHKLESFTLHVEQLNADSDENIVYDLFGCLVNSITISASKDDDTIKASVEIICPYYSEGNAVSSIPSASSKHPFTWNMVDTTVKALEENSVDILPKSVTSIELTISNGIEIKADIGKLYAVHPIAKKREIDYKITGFTDEKILFDYWKDTWDNTNNRYTSATTKISGILKIIRGTNDFISIPMYNLYLDEHSCHIHSIDETIKAVDITLKDAMPDSTTKKWFYDGSNNIEIEDDFDEMKYHNTT